MGKVESLLKKIIKSRQECWFVSPHLDDAVLSCGGLITALAVRTKVSVLTIFTRAGTAPETKFARKFVSSCGYTDSSRLFSERLREDQAIFRKLLIKSHYFDFVDAAWRKKAHNQIAAKVLELISLNLTHVYPSQEDVFSGKVSGFDRSTYLDVEKKLSDFLPDKNTLLFVPIGTGSHVDHVLVREVCRKNYKNVIYWSDFPYELRRGPDESFIKANKLSSFTWDKNIEIKKELIGLYKTQFKSIFPSGRIPTRDETYFFSERDFRILR